MTLVSPCIIAPDSSHWAKWLDAMRSFDPDRRRRGSELHVRMVENARIPLLSWHHLEELLGVDDDVTARARVATIQRLELLAWLRLPHEDSGLGSVAQVLTAEMVAACEGNSDLRSVRDRARTLLLRVGSGTQAIGEKKWVWEAVRPMLRARRRQLDMVAALRSLRVFNDKQTIGQLAKKNDPSLQEIRSRLERVRVMTFRKTLHATRDEPTARAMTNNFMDEVCAMMPPVGITMRDLVVTKLIEQGLDEDEVRDEYTLTDLNRLAMFRSQLRLIAPETGQSLDELKKVPMDILPSRVIDHALRIHGQPRGRRPGSDVNDLHLAVLAAYCDVLYVDKRIAEDFRRARQKDHRLERILGEIAKAADFEALLGTAAD